MNLRSPSQTLSFLSPLCFLVALACTTTGGAQRGESERVVLVEGSPVRAEDLARGAYEEARAAREVADLAGARGHLDRIRNDYSDTSWVDHANVFEAQLLLDEGRPADAQARLEAFLLASPASAAADEARYYLALSQLAQGDAQSASPTLEKVVDALPTDDGRRQAALQLAEQLARSGAAAEALRYYARAHELSDDAESRAHIEAQLLSLVDRGVAFADVRRLLETEAKGGTFFDELLRMKLARIHLHLRDYRAASEAASAYLQQYTAGRFVTEARTLVERLRVRVTVNPRAVGVILPLSGTYKSYGQRTLTAIKLGLGLPASRDDRKGTLDAIETERVRLVVRDSQGDPAIATAALEELVESEHVVAVIGDILLNTALPVALKAEELGVPLLSLSRREGVAQLGPYSFRISFTAQKQAEALVALAMDELGHKRFAILYPRHSYGLELMNAFWDAVERRRGEVTAIESYNHDQTTFTTEAKRLVGRLDLEARREYAECRSRAQDLADRYQRKKALERCRDSVSPIVDFDALLIPDDYRTVSYVIPALVAEDILVSSDKMTVQAYRKTTQRERARPVQLLGGSMWNDPELAERLGRQVDGAVLVDGFSARDGTDKAMKFVERFSDVHRSSPTLMEAQAYDAGHLMAAILEGRTQAAPKSREEMREVLAGVRDFPGVTGLVRFDLEGDSDTPPRFFRVRKGKIEETDVASLKSEGDG